MTDRAVMVLQLPALALPPGAGIFAVELLTVSRVTPV
jgi:hypothetical protein